MPEFELTLGVWEELEGELRGLFAAHSQEVGTVDGKPGLDVDWEQADVLARGGVLQIAIARRVGPPRPLVGYCIWYLTPSLERRGQMLAQQGPWFVSPAYRVGLGLRLLRFGLGAMQGLGASVALLHRYASSDERLDGALRRLGAKPLEIVYSLSLEDL